MAVLSVVLFSCNKEENLVDPADNKVEINEDTQAAIQNFINQVNGVTTRSDVNFNSPKPKAALRYFKPGATECINKPGNCAPDVIIYPSPGPDWIWINSHLGQQLQQLVDKKQVVVQKDFNSSTNTEFYIYNSVDDRNLEIVIPVVYK